MNMPPQTPPQPPRRGNPPPYAGQGQQQPFNPGAGSTYGPQWRGNATRPVGTASPPHHPKSGSQPAAQATPPLSTPRPIPMLKQRGVTYFLWRFGDVQMIDVLSQQWLRSVRPHMAGLYLLVFLALTFVTGVLTWFFDVRPSLAFATYVGQNAFNQPILFHLDAQVTSVLTMLVIGILSITPNLLEFFTVGLALQGNIAVDLALKAALVFDALTDAPGALAFAKTVVAFFTPDLPAVLVPVVPWVEVALSGPVLLLATIVIETLFLSFVLASFRLLWHSISRPRPMTRPMRNP